MAWQPPAQPESVVWQFRSGQDFYVEETQRQLLQVKGITPVTTYFDFTYLWHYTIQKVTQDEISLIAVLEKVRVNNSTEMGGKTSELLKKHEKTKSNWILNKTPSGWQVRASAGPSSPHGKPYFLTLGTTAWESTPPSWKQTWGASINKIGNPSVALTVLLKQQTAERVFVNSRAQLEWPEGAVNPYKIKLQSSNNATVGLGEYDLTKSRWIHFEFYTSGNWSIPGTAETLQMKQDSYTGYRFYERRPTFP